MHVYVLHTNDSKRKSNKPYEYESSNVILTKFLLMLQIYTISISYDATYNRFQAFV